MANALHQCPKCGEFHRGDYSQCERCLAAPKDPDADPTEGYDFASDDFHSEVRRGR